MIEAARDGQILLVACERVDVGQRLTHAAVLDSQHPLSLFGCERACYVVHPVGQFERDRLRLLIAREHPGVFESGQHFMLRVPRNPRATLEVEIAVHFNLARSEAAHRFKFRWRQRTDVAVAICSLALGHLSDDVSDAVAKARVARRGVLLRERR
jgi:hypothetical protein